MGNISAYQEKEVLMIKDGEKKYFADTVATEYPLTIFFNDKEIITLLCTPDKLENLALGFLFSEGFLEDKGEVSQLYLDKENGIVYVNTVKEKSLADKLYGKRTITTGCGKGTVFFSAWDALKSKKINSEMQINASTILKHMHSLQSLSSLYKQTGGVHSAALADLQQLMYICEDVGRHNAVDKIVGECLDKGAKLHDKVLICSGRLSSEMLMKTAKLGIPVLVSRAAPTTLSVEVADAMGVSLVGFVRGARLTVYSHSRRIVHN